jgi:preprotein translocase subunit YajC
MPIEFDVISLLSTPLKAAIVVILVVAVFSVFFYYLPKKLSSNAQKNYIPRIQFIAEILVSIGLIGLVTFSGRAKFDSDAVQLKEVAYQSEREVAASFYPYQISECLSPSQPPTASAVSVICSILKDFNNVHDIELPWHEASRKLEDLAAQEGLYPPLRENIKKMFIAINQMQDARDRVALVPLKRDILTSKTPWCFILICAFLACVGVALKCARAALMLWSPVANAPNVTGIVATSTNVEHPAIQLSPASSLSQTDQTNNPTG